MSDQLNEPIHGVSFDGELKPIVDFGKSLSRPQKIIDRMAHYKTPAVSIALIQNFKVVQVLSYGRISAGNSEATPNTLFQAASISKSVSAMAALALVRSGKIELQPFFKDYLTKTMGIPGIAMHPVFKRLVRRLQNDLSKSA